MRRIVLGEHMATPHLLVRRTAHVDGRFHEMAFFYWKTHDEEWIKGIGSYEDIPENLRGAFSWKRLRDQPAENESGAG